MNEFTERTRGTKVKDFFHKFRTIILFTKGPQNLHIGQLDIEASRKMVLTGYVRNTSCMVFVCASKSKKKSKKKCLSLNLY